MKVKSMVQHNLAAGLPVPKGLILSGELVPLLAGTRLAYAEWSNWMPMWLPFLLSFLHVAHDLLQLYQEGNSRSPARVFFSVDYIRALLCLDITDVEPKDLLNAYIRMADLQCCYVHFDLACDFGESREKRQREWGVSQCQIAGVSAYKKRAGLSRVSFSQCPKTLVVVVFRSLPFRSLLVVLGSIVWKKMMMCSTPCTISLFRISMLLSYQDRWPQHLRCRV